jgi:hypothetical protein
VDHFRGASAPELPQLDQIIGALAEDPADRNNIVALAEESATDRNTIVASVITLSIFHFVLVGTLTLLVSRRRSKIAMWILIALGALDLSLAALGIIQAVSDIIWAALETSAKSWPMACSSLHPRDAG